MAGIDMGAFQREVDRNFAQRQQQVTNATKLVALEAARNPAQIAQAQSSANLNNVTASELPLNGAMDRRTAQADLDSIGPLAFLSDWFQRLGGTTGAVQRFAKGAAAPAAPAAPAAGAIEPSIQGRAGSVKTSRGLPSYTGPSALVPAATPLQQSSLTAPAASATSITQAANVGMTDSRPRRSFNFGTMFT